MDRSLDPRELEATRFAFALLMPEKMVRDAIKELYPDGINLQVENPIKELADLFLVEPHIMWIRLGQIKAVAQIY